MKSTILSFISEIFLLRIFKMNSRKHYFSVQLRFVGDLNGN